MEIAKCFHSAKSVGAKNIDAPKIDLLALTVRDIISYVSIRAR